METSAVRGSGHGREVEGNEESGGGGAGTAGRIEGREGAGGEAFRIGQETHRRTGREGAMGEKAGENSRKALNMLERSGMLTS